MTNRTLPKPAETLSGCVWLPRFIAKVRLAQAGLLEGDYLLAFCHPKGVDGRFLQHFELEKDEAIAEIVAAGDDQALAAWFRSMPGVSEESIAAWNEFAPKIGSPGQPGERELAFMIRRGFPDGIPPEATSSAFAVIAWDER